MSKQITVLFPKIVGNFEMPDAVTHQHVIDALADDGFLPWLKGRIRDRKPPGWTIDSWGWVLKVLIDGEQVRFEGGESE